MLMVLDEGCYEGFIDQLMTGGLLRGNLMVGICIAQSRVDANLMRDIPRYFYKSGLPQVGLPFN